MTFGGQISSQGGKVDGTVLGLEEVGMHRLVGEKERQGPVVRWLDKSHRASIEEIGDIALHRSECAVLEELRINQLPLPSKIEKNFDVSFIVALALGEKHIQQNYRPVSAVHQWFTRRPGTLFRSLLLSEFGHGALRAIYLCRQGRHV